MNNLDFRILEAFPEPEFSLLAREAFSDFGPQSQQLADVLATEAAHRDGSLKLADPPRLRIGAFRGERLVGWTFAQAEPGPDLCMVNSGVARAERRHGVYTRLVQMTLEHAASRGYRRVTSRHVPSNNAVIIPKLRLGVHVSGFEYSEVYGPLVRLTHLVGAARRALYQARAAPIVPAARIDREDA